MGRFNFTGTVRFNDLDNKYPYMRSGTTKGGNKYKSVNFFVNSAENNSANVELFGQVSDVVITSSNKNKVEVPWDERKDKDWVESVDSWRKNTVVIGEDRNTFISSYDAAVLLADEIPNLKDKKVTVTGQIKPQSYNGKVSFRFQIQNVYSAGEDKKPGLIINEEFYLNKDSFDFDSFKSDKLIYINGWVKDYIDKEHPSVYIPKQLVIDCNKVDFDSENDVKMFNGRWFPMKLKYENGKPTIGLKSNKMYAMAMIERYVNGAQAEEFTIDMLTDTQRTMVELGVRELEDFRPKGTAYGNRITLYKLINLDLVDDYTDGIVTLDDSVEEFEENIYVVADDKPKEEKKKDEDDLPINKPEKEEEEKKPKSKKKEEEKSDVDDALDALFETDEDDIFG